MCVAADFRSRVVGWSGHCYEMFRGEFVLFKVFKENVGTCGDFLCYFGVIDLKENVGTRKSFKIYKIVKWIKVPDNIRV